MKKKKAFAVVGFLLLGYTAISGHTQATPTHSYKVQTVDVFSSKSTLTKVMGQQIDSTGNLITTNSNGGVDVISFKDLTPAQIKILQEKGIKFPKALLEEKMKK